MDSPSLIENSTKYLLINRLKKCNEYKTNIFSWVTNTSIFVLFFGILFVVLYYCRKEKLSPYEESERIKKDQHFIVSKIRDYQEIKKTSTSTNITNLPIINKS